MKRAVPHALLSLAVLIGGCSGRKENPAGPGDKMPPAYSRATPQETLASLLTAYANRDSSEYRKLLAFDYRGQSYDVSDSPGPQPGTFTFQDEVSHIRALAVDPSVVRIFCDFGPSSSWTVHPATGPMGETWAEIVIYNPALEIVTVYDSFIVGRNEVMAFQFARDTTSTSPPDTAWSVVRWYEDYQ